MEQKPQFSSQRPHNDQEVVTLLEQLLEGRLSERESSEVLNLVTESDEFLELADQMWERYMASLTEQADVQPPAVQRLEQALANRIQRAELTRQVIRFGTEGFSQVLITFLRPFLAMGSQQNHGGKT